MFAATTMTFHFLLMFVHTCRAMICDNDVQWECDLIISEFCFFFIGTFLLLAISSSFLKRNVNKKKALNNYCWIQSIHIQTYFFRSYISFFFHSSEKNQSVCNGQNEKTTRFMTLFFYFLKGMINLNVCSVMTPRYMKFKMEQK